MVGLAPTVSLAKGENGDAIVYCCLLQWVTACNLKTEDAPIVSTAFDLNF